MKIKLKTLISSFLLTILCASLIAGATFAMYTSDSKAFVDITSGKRDFAVTVTDLTKTPSVVDDDPLVSLNSEDDELTLSSFNSGDKISFKLNIENKSNVSVLYRPFIKLKTDGGLFTALKITLNDVVFSGTDAISAWNSLLVGVDPLPVTVEITLPSTAGSTFSDKTCVLSFGVESVFMNMHVNDVEVADKYLLTVKYVNETTGSEIAASHFEYLTEGESYSVTSPTVENLTIKNSEQAVVSGTMTNSDVTVIVYYVQAEVPPVEPIVDPPVAGPLSVDSGIWIKS